MYVIQADQTVLQFPVGSGALTPSSELIPPNGLQVTSVAVDSSGQIYLGISSTVGDNSILVYPAGSSGQATPTRSIDLTVGDPPNALTVDTASSVYEVDDIGHLQVFSSTASGAATPSISIYGPFTQLGFGVGVAVDPTGNIYVATEIVTGTSNATGAIDIFAAGANGDVAPTRVITNADVYLGIAVDAAGNIYAPLDNLVAPYSSYLVVYSATADGAATPSNLSQELRRRW